MGGHFGKYTGTDFSLQPVVKTAVNHCFFLVRGGAAAHGVVFTSTLAFSASIVKRNGLLLNAVGTPSHRISLPTSGFPASGVSSLMAISAGPAAAPPPVGTDTRSSLERHAGLPSTTTPRS